MWNEFIILNVMIFICIAFGPLWITSPKFRYYFKVILYTICLVTAGTVGACLSLPNGRTPKNHWHTFRTFQLLTFWCGISYEIRNRNFIEVDNSFIVVANHQTLLDVLTLTYVWPKNCVVLLKSSLKFMPGFNVCAYLCEAIFINRFSKVAAHKSVEKAISAVRNYRKIWIFPEGTRNSSGTMLPFKKGAFIIAREANVPIIPIVISSYQSFYRKDDYKFDYGGRVIIEILPAIDPFAYSDVDSVSEECHKQMENVYRKISNELCSK
ncbi:Acyltransferase family protein [Brugia malayi]|uniref:1-acyl-sn-glycerol-3-phosphate acyltransferase n=1 Tax=Brugia malayi TaxID=6279 RepID=A0A0K0JFE1_BRUMA|nr:Acyltransferase family protein [Brugia malayi]CTP80858.1 BMA-ACL-1 [Brugia malayi]VIO89249.1 Acyltransferase family protein [Brugia malayi]